MLIDDIHDITRIYGHLIDAHYEVTCPYCDTTISLIPFSKECEQIDQYRKYNAISNDDMGILVKYTGKFWNDLKIGGLYNV